MTTRILPPALLLALAACSTADNAPAGNQTATAPAEPAAATPAPAQPTAAPTTPTATPTPTPTATPSPSPSPSPTAAAHIIGLEGLGTLHIGQPVPKGSGWAERGAQAGDACRTVTSPAYPGVYAIVSGGKVRRITVGQRSDVKLVEGIGVGSSEAQVRQWFGGFRATPHKYEAAPAKYLTAPNAASGDPAVRFEIGRDRKVKLIHVGTMPELGFVEGCG